MVEVAAVALTKAAVAGGHIGTRVGQTRGNPGLKGGVVHLEVVPATAFMGCIYTWGEMLKRLSMAG